jgi:tryptophanyl-tRNA synthetase
VPRAKSAAPVAKQALPVFKQYREADGRFHFKLSAADGTVLLQGGGFAEGREAGGLIKRLKTEGTAALRGAPIEVLAPMPQIESALATLAAQDD